jgi:cardiolipin synthase
MASGLIFFWIHPFLNPTQTVFNPPFQGYAGVVSASEPLPTEMVFQEGDLYFENLCLSIAEARSTIDFESYIFDLDALGNAILERLAEATQRGVRVRLLLDGVGSSQWTGEDTLPWIQRGVNIRFFHPLPWQKNNFKFWNYLTVQKLWMGAVKLNHRNHRKIILIDGTVLFIGSMNVSARHLPSLVGPLAWRDTALKIREPNLNTIQDAFELAWRNSIDYVRGWKQTWKKFVSLERLRLNYSRTLGHQYHQNLLSQIKTAQERVWITNPYFVPDRSLLSALISAAKRKVDVKLLFPKRTDFFPGKYAAESFYTKLLRSGVQIYEYLPSILHAKVVILDESAIVGSSNLNHRSIFMDLEADVITQRPQTIATLSGQFIQDLTNSQAIRLAEWNQRPWVHRFLEQLFLLFRRIL